MTATESMTGKSTMREVLETFPGAQRALSELRQTVVLDESRGDISATRAAEILRAATGVENLLVLDVRSTVPSTAATVVPSTAPTTASTRRKPPAPSPRDSKNGRKPKGHGDG